MWYVVIKRELEAIFKRPYMAFCIFILPFIFCFVLFLIFAKGAIKDLPIAVLDLDNSKISRNIIRMLDATPSMSVKYKVSNLKEGHDLITEGKSYALFYIPKDFYKDILKGKRPPVVFYYNNQAILIGGVISKDASTVIQTVIAGINVLTKHKLGVPYHASLNSSNVIRVDERLHSNPYLNYSYFLGYISFAQTFQIIITLISIWAIAREFKEGTTLELLKLTNDSIFKAVFYKFSFYVLLFMFEFSVIFFLYSLCYNAPMRGNIIFLGLSSIAFIFAYQMMGLLFVSLTSNLRFSLSVGAFYTSMGFTLAGMTYPVIAMPFFIRAYSSLLPIRPYINVVIDQTLRGFSPIYDIKYVLWILAISLFGILSLPLLKKNMQNKEKWCKV